MKTGKKDGLYRKRRRFDRRMRRAVRALLLAACGLLAFAAGAVRAAEEDPKLDSIPQQVAPRAFADDEKPKPKPGWGEDEHKSYLVPALDIFAFDGTLNLLNRYVLFPDEGDFDSTLDTIRDHWHGKWVYDNDPFTVNQFGHPYQGNMYHGFARSAGLDYWTSSVYTILGSAAWEIAGEATPPSINDQITTGFGGSFLGEPLFRIASLLLETADGRKPGRWREIGAAVISPSLGINRLFYGDRFDPVFRSRDPAVYTRIDLGANVGSHTTSNVNVNPDPTLPTTPQSYEEGEVIGDFTLAYGLPGKPGYTHTRPFDYFHLQFTAATSNVLENVITRGMLYGTDYEWGEDYRGIWGVYGSYDYIAPQIFRISTTALNVGTTMQWWPTKEFAVQGTALAGLGYGSAGTIRGVNDRDYHHGMTPQGLLALRFIWNDRVSLDTNARQYYVTDRGGGGDNEGEEHLTRLDASLTVRVWNLHGITFKYVATRRDASYANFPNTQQDVGAFSIGYALLGQTRSGAVDWRPPGEGGPGSLEKVGVKPVE